MKEIINILMYKDVGYFLKGENLQYIIHEKDGIYTVKELPHTINEYMSSIKDYFAYDYDNLCPLNQDLYQDEYKSLIKTKNNNYEVQTKTYKIKKK